MIATENEIRIAGIENDSIVDGPGLRMAIFFQGCRRACADCHNSGSWPVIGGAEAAPEEILAKIDGNPLLRGVTFSGGEPLIRAAALVLLAKGIAARQLDLAIYTGYTFEEIIEDGDEDVLCLLSYASTLIDGPFVKAQKSLTLPFRGSENQRILDMKRSLAERRAVPTANPAWDYDAEN
ncbi:MAG: radical SAM protein [Clostridiales Family XIII bacterium]|nr:radical SAM protein [Clostridiales Family XIII bacterium]